MSRPLYILGVLAASYPCLGLITKCLFRETGEAGAASPSGLPRVTFEPPPGGLSVYVDRGIFLLLKAGMFDLSKNGADIVPMRQQNTPIQTN